LKDGKLPGAMYNVVTAQSRSLFFAEITKHTENVLGSDIPVKALLIVASNNIFDELLRSRILKT